MKLRCCPATVDPISDKSELLLWPVKPLSWINQDGKAVRVGKPGNLAVLYLSGTPVEGWGDRTRSKETEITVSYTTNCRFCSLRFHPSIPLQAVYRKTYKFQIGVKIDGFSKPIFNVMLGLGKHNCLWVSGY